MGDETCIRMGSYFEILYDIFRTKKLLMTNYL
jgi:hypothetical protein